MRRCLPLLVVLVASALIASSCHVVSNPAGDGPDTAASVKYAESGTFTIAIPDDLGSFDPYQSNLIKAYYKLAYDSLVNVQRDGTILSGLAQKWEADAHSATFTLRRDVTCSDGTPLTAAQVAADLTYAGDQANKSSLYGSQVPLVPFTATGDNTKRTVEITMKSPYGFILYTIGVTPIVCARGMRDRKLLAAGSDGTGPFVLTGVVPGQSYQFTVRKNYNWGPAGIATTEPGIPARVILTVVPNETTAANLLLSGDINAAAIAGDDASRLQSSGLRKIDTPGSGAWLWFNHLGKRATADKRVRQALARALDLDSVIKVNTGGAGKTSTGLITLEPKPCPTDTVADHLPTHDVAAAEATLDRVGWRNDGDGVRRKAGKPLTIDLHFVPPLSRYNKATAELIAEQWKSIGVQVKLTPDTVTGMNQVMFQASNYDVYMQGFGSNVPSAMVKYLSDRPPPRAASTLPASTTRTTTH